MPRGNGSYVGIDANPTSSVASGIWTVREAETLLRADKWPSQPSVPGAPSGTAGNGQVSLTWSAPSLGSPPTDYEVQYSSNGGSSWTTFSDGVSTNTSATVTGLTNGTAYIFRVRAVNALGEGPYGSASGTVTPANTTKLLLHFDGSNGSTTFSDSSPLALGNLAVTGSPAISTAQSKFGGASGLFVYNTNGSDYIALDASTAANCELGAGDFTIDFWIYPTDDYGGIVGNRADAAGASDAVYQILFYGSARTLHWHTMTSIVLGGATQLAANQWSHVAYVRDSGTLTLYVNGVSDGSASDSRNYNDDFDLNISRDAGNSGASYHGFGGYLDELRISVGVAVWSGNFTPPTGPY